MVNGCELFKGARGDARGTPFKHSATLQLQACAVLAYGKQPPRLIFQPPFANLPKNAHPAMGRRKWPGLLGEHPFPGDARRNSFSGEIEITLDGRV